MSVRNFISPLIEPFNLESIIYSQFSTQPQGDVPTTSGITKNINGDFDPTAGLEFGYAFIEKFIQLPFRVPEPALPDIERFLDKISRSSGTEEDESTQNIYAANVTIDVRDSDIGISQRNPFPEDGDPDAGMEEYQQGQEDELAVRPVKSPSILQLKRRERIKLEVTADSRTVRNIILIVAPFLDYNPHRIKQFINLFRLKTFIASETGLFDINGEDEGGLTLEQLGKFAAIELRWPRLFSDLDLDRTLLTKLQKVSVGYQLAEDEATATMQKWTISKDLTQLLSYGCVVGKQPFSMESSSLESLEVNKLFQIAPPITKV